MSLFFGFFLIWRLGLLSFELSRNFGCLRLLALTFFLLSSSLGLESFFGLFRNLFLFFLLQAQSFGGLLGFDPEAFSLRLFGSLTLLFFLGSCEFCLLGLLFLAETVGLCLGFR